MEADRVGEINSLVSMCRWLVEKWYLGQTIKQHIQTLSPSCLDLNRTTDMRGGIENCNR